MHELVGHDHGSALIIHTVLPIPDLIHVAVANMDATYGDPVAAEEILSKLSPKWYELLGKSAEDFALGSPNFPTPRT